MDRNEFNHVAMLAVRPAYRYMFLKERGVKSPFNIMLNPNGVHYQFVALDIDNAAAAHAADNPVDVFLVDSLKWPLAEVKTTKFFVLAAIHFIKMGLEWMNRFVQKKSLAKRVSDAIPDHTAFLEEVITFKMKVHEVSLIQTNSYDCGIFTILQMNRLSMYLYGTDVTSSFAGETLLSEHVVDCLMQSIKGSKPPNQGLVDKWRTSEFLYLLSIWIKRVSQMITAAGSLEALNKTLKTDFKSIVKIPYIGVKYQGKNYYVKAVDYTKWEIKAASDSHEEIIELHQAKDKKWWTYMKFISSPTANDLPEQLKMPFKQLTDSVPYVPSTSDLCKFYPGHTSDDKYIASDYLFWKLRIMDETKLRMSVGLKLYPTAAIVGLCINTFHVDKATRSLRPAPPMKKRKRGEGTSATSASVDLISDDEGVEGEGGGYELVQDVFCDSLAIKVR